MAANAVLRSERQPGEAEWAELLYSACETLNADSGQMMTAMSVAVPRTECPDNSAKVGRLSYRLAKECDLQVTVEVRDRIVLVRFARPAARG